MNASLKDARILIIDDHQSNIELLENFLLVKGYTKVKAIYDARKAIQEIKTYQPDLVLLDLMMPYLSGFEIMQKLEAEGLMSRLMPIMVLTADSSMEAKQRALTCGASDFTTKPFNLIEVDLRIKNLLLNVYLLSQLKNQNQQLETSVAERTSDLERAKRTVEESEERYRSLFNANKDCIILFQITQSLPDVIIDCNSAASEILGYTKKELLNMTIASIDESFSPTIFKEQIELIEKTNVINYETNYRCKNEQIKQVNVLTSIIHLQGKDVVMQIARDVTQSKALQAAHEVQHDKLKEIAWTQSHLVRAPLAKIIAATDLLIHAQVNFDDDTKELLEALELSSKELDNIIRQITATTYQQ